MNESDTNQLSIFISHRHEDKNIADVFREAFRDWSNAAIRVFQSSSSKNAIAFGDELDDSIRAAIANSNIVLLIYTLEDFDWSWCLYECGLAQDPKTMDTRILVFHSTEAPPPQLAHLVTIPFTEQAVKTLSENFHRQADFFPRYNTAFAPDLEQDQIDERASELYQDLSEAIPIVGAKEVQRYDYITLGLDLDLVLQLRETDEKHGYTEAMEQSRGSLKENAIVRRVKGEPQAHFNFEVIAEGTHFSDLVERWKRESEYTHIEWYEELYSELARAVLNRKERAVSLAFNSLEPDTALWILPVVTRFRILPSENFAEFDVTMCSMQSDAAEKMSSSKS